MNLIEKTEDVISEIVEKMNIIAAVDVDQREDSINASISGEDAAILIGREGRTLDALQLITNIIVNKGREDRVRILIDVEGYKDKRKESLERLANGYAEKVVSDNAPMSLEPMSPFDRRIIHMTLRESTSVITESQGEGSDRHIIIKPL